MTITEILQDIVFPCCYGSTMLSGRPALEGVHAFFCAKEINDILCKGELNLSFYDRSGFTTHKEGINIITNWASSYGLKFDKEVDLSIGVADVLVYSDDIGIFEIGTILPTKMILLLRYIIRLDGLYTVHFWPYGVEKSFVFSNWI